LNFVFGNPVLSYASSASSPPFTGKDKNSLKRYNHAGQILHDLAVHKCHPLSTLFPLKNGFQYLEILKARLQQIQGNYILLATEVNWSIQMKTKWNNVLQFLLVLTSKKKLLIHPQMRQIMMMICHLNLLIKIMTMLTVTLLLIPLYLVTR
jgi:hypothetical protein